MDQQEDKHNIDAQEDKPTERARMTQVAGDITGQRWCGYHQGYGNASTGQFVERGGRKRWMCHGCLVRRNLASA